MVAVQPPIFYGYQDDNPWVFKFWIFAVEQFFAQVHLSNDKQKMWYAKTRVSGRALKYWNHYENLHFRRHWSLITWESMKEDLCIVYFPQIFTRIKSQLHNLIILVISKIRVIHEISTIRQDLEDLIKRIQDLSLQMNQKETQLDSMGVSKMIDRNEITDSHIEDNVGNGILVMKGDQVPP